MSIDTYFSSFDNVILTTTLENINQSLSSITSQIDVDAIPVEERVRLSNHILHNLSRPQRMQLAKSLIEEQFINQKRLLSHWSLITAQSSMIDTGYIAQHLVSLQTQIAGQGMRGKGLDLCDGSEVKGANFIDSLDKNGATAPRWNFNSVSVDIMERFLSYPAIYLLSMDLNPQHTYRIRIWRVDIQRHTILRNRYQEWMNKLGYQKFKASTHKSINFQLFPPRNGTDETFARHGNGRSTGFPKLEIPLEDSSLGSELIFRCDVENDQVVISRF